MSESADFSDDGQATVTTEGGEEAQERFRLNPETISEAFADDERTPERIVAMIEDVDQRRQLADEIMQKMPAASAEFGDIEKLNQRLDMMAEVLPQKKTFFDRVKEKCSWALEKIKGVLTHPVVVTIIVGLLAWWAWGHLHGILAAAHGEAAEAAAGAMGGATEGAGAINPSMGPGLMKPGGAIGAPDPTIFERLPLRPPSSQPPMPPMKPPA